MKLRPYQQQALQEIQNALHNRGIKRQLVVSPTGSGKTVVLSHIPQIIDGPMLVLAHREELLEQSAATIRQVNPSLVVEIEQAERHASPQADVVVASVPTLGRDGSDRIMKFDKNYFSSIIIDECHHVVGKTYQNILDYFTPQVRVGFTATPQRGDKIRLLDHFDEIVFFRTIREMIDEGYLVNVVGYKISTGTDISKVSVRAGDYAIGELSEAINVAQRNKRAVEAYSQLVPGKKMLVFCVDVAHAYEMAKEFRKANIQAAALDGTSDKDLRRTVVDDFQNGQLQVLCNVNLFTEGTDIPSIDCVMFARPTRSPVMYSQGVGRGMRLFEGKQTCTVIDLCDVTKGKKPVGLPTLMGLPPDLDLQGKTLTEAKDTFDELEELCPELAARAGSFADLTTSIEQVDLFKPPPANEELQLYTRLIWMETSDDTYILNLGGQERLKIQGDALGRYRVWLRHSDGNQYELTQREGACKDIQEAFQRSDKWVKKFRSDQLTLLDNTAAWREDAPTEKQAKFLRKHGIPVVSDLTKGQASQLISKIIEDNPKPERPAWVERKIARSKSNTKW